MQLTRSLGVVGLLGNHPVSQPNGFLRRAVRKIECHDHRNFHHRVMMSIYTILQPDAFHQAEAGRPVSSIGRA